MVPSPKWYSATPQLTDTRVSCPGAISHGVPDGAPQAHAAASTMPHQHDDSHGAHSDTAQKAVETATAELTAHESDRRRALHEVSDRLRQRERELRDRIAREETEAVARIQSSFADVERRQADQLSRVVERTANRLSEAAAAEFSDRAKTARDDAAKRLARELERAVESFARQAQTVLAERLAQVADAGGQRVDQRLNQIRGKLDEERDEVLGGYEQKLAASELELRDRLQALAADAEAEREVIEARLHELARRVDELSSRAEARVPETFRAE